ncbi:MAG TPA: hypothetical protein VG674_03910 [Amycolatopsis sp.]|nr:hypothetical protein [Amycolatopsis sp.]
MPGRDRHGGLTVCEGEQHRRPDGQDLQDVDEAQPRQLADLFRGPREHPREHDLRTRTTAFLATIHKLAEFTGCLDLITKKLQGCKEHVSRGTAHDLWHEPAAD